MYNAPIQHYNVFWCERWKGTMWEVNIFARFDYNQRKLSICHVILVPFLVSIMDAVHTHNGARKRTNVSVCLKLFFSFLFLILLHEYCYLNLTAFVVLTKLTHDCIIGPHGTINCTLLLSLLTQNVFITCARLLFWYYLLKL